MEGNTSMSQNRTPKRSWARGAMLVALLSAAGRCGSQDDPIDSESHFACEDDSDCSEHLALPICVDRVCAAIAKLTDAGPKDAPPVRQESGAVRHADAAPEAGVCVPPAQLAYQEPGCGAAARAVCFYTTDACAGPQVCTCSGQTTWGACGAVYEPFAHFGPCLDGGPPASESTETGTPEGAGEEPYDAPAPRSCDAGCPAVSFRGSGTPMDGCCLPSGECGVHTDDLSEILFVSGCYPIAYPSQPGDCPDVLIPVGRGAMIIPIPGCCRAEGVCGIDLGNELGCMKDGPLIRNELRCGSN